MSSFFGEQEGDFTLSIVSIAAWKDSREDNLGLEKEEGAIIVESKEAPDYGSWRVYGDDSSPACCVIL